MLTVIGVRHHSPACARLVRETIEELRPAHVLIEGPADMNDRIGEFLLGHELPIAVFTSARASGFSRASWSPFCDYSPEWVALTEGHRAGAQVRFIDLPAWHPAFAERENRYADDAQRYTQAVEALCSTLGMDNADTLWDHLVEIDAESLSRADMAARLEAYFDLIRGEPAPAPPGYQPTTDEVREEYMARWIAAAQHDAPDRPVVVVCGGFHRPALIRRAATVGDTAWPTIPSADPETVAVSYLVPYSFRRLDAFDGYQSGMPSPAYYQRLWERGPRGAATSLTEEVVTRLRERRQQVSTADLIAARVTAEGLAAVRGHRHPGRADLLDGLVSALVTEALDRPLPWTGRGQLAAGTHPAVVEMVAALAGTKVGRLHPDTPMPPLVHDVAAGLERHGLLPHAAVALDLTVPERREASRLLHRLRVLGIPGYERVSGPAPGADDSVLIEEWSPQPDRDRLAALIEAGGYGPTVEQAARARLGERVLRSPGLAGAAAALFDAVLCGCTELSDQVIAGLGDAVRQEGDPVVLGGALTAVLSLWRHDRLLAAADSATLGAVVAAAVTRLLWLLESVQGGTNTPADRLRLMAVVAVRDSVRHGAGPLRIDTEHVLAVMGRIAANPDAPPDLRGAGYGLGWSLGAVPPDSERAVRGASAPDTFGDWLAGLFALAREQVLEAGNVLDTVDELVSAMSDRNMLIALPALRQAFSYFPPRERETIADRVMDLHDADDTGRSLLRSKVDDPLALARGRELDSFVQELLEREGLAS